MGGEWAGNWGILVQKWVLGVWRRGGEEHWTAQCPRAAASAVCSVGRYGAVLSAGTWTIGAARCHPAPPARCGALSRKGFLFARWNEKRGGKGAREGDGKLGRKLWSGGWQRRQFLGFTQSMDHWVLEYLLTVWATAEAHTARSLLRITAYTLLTMQRGTPSSPRLVTSFLPVYATHDVQGHELAVPGHEDEVTALVQASRTVLGAGCHVSSYLKKPLKIFKTMIKAEG